MILATPPCQFNADCKLGLPTSTMGPMHAFRGATNKPGEDGVRSGYHTASTYAPGKPDGCLWCFKREEDAAAFRAWCEANRIVVGGKPP